jgi:quercetin dioxygenase-like cupin family protein
MGLLLAATAQGADAGKAKAPYKGGAGNQVIMPAGDLKFVAAPGAPPGVQQAVLWGDPAKGAFGAIQKFVPGFLAPLHTHSANLRIVVISGTMIYTPEGQPEVRLSAGSFFNEPANHKHTTACDKASDCVFFVEGTGKFDIKMVEEKTPAKM